MVKILFTFNSDMKLAKSLVLVIIAAILLAFAASFLIDYGLRNSDEDMFGKVGEMIDGKENYDVLFIGSSRTAAHIDPSIIDNKLGSNSYNAGLNGISVQESKMLLDLYYKQHEAPKLVMVNVDINTFSAWEVLSEVQRYYPYSHISEVKETISPYDNGMATVSKLPFLKIAYYDDRVTYLGLKKLLGIEKAGNYALYKGYRKNNKQWGIKQDMFFEQKEQDTAYSRKKGMKLLSEMHQLATERGSQLILHSAPIYKPYLKKIDSLDSYFEEMNAYCLKNDIPFLRDELHEIGGSKDNFYDLLHMNINGAEAYSTLLAEKMTDYYE